VASHSPPHAAADPSTCCATRPRVGVVSPHDTGTAQSNASVLVSWAMMQNPATRFVLRIRRTKFGSSSTGRTHASRHRCENNDFCTFMVPSALCPQQIPSTVQSWRKVPPNASATHAGDIYVDQDVDCLLHISYIAGMCCNNEQLMMQTYTLTSRYSNK